MEGQVIAGKYQLVRLLGQGGMGAVYEGRNAVTYKRCAIKLLLYPELSHDGELVKRFFREARAGSAIESDHVIEIYDSGADERSGCPYIVMELLRGEDLDQVVKRLRPVDPTAAVKLILQAAVGLAKAHSAGIVHRDIKPANLFLTQRDAGDLIVKILDFGIAKIKMENFHETSAALTRSGSLLGTPLYMSPEQCKGASAIDARSDVWSLGVVLWELLTGQSPYPTASSLGSLMASIITEDLPLLQDQAPWVPPEIAEVVHRAMSRDLTKRFRDAGEVRDALSQNLGAEGPMLWPQMLVSVPDEQRRVAAPRLVLTHDGMLRASGRPVEKVSQPGDGKRWLARGFFVVAAAGALAAAAAVSFNRASPSGEAAESQRLPKTASPPTVVTEPTPVLRKFSLDVGPKGVELSVDGARAVAKDGKLELDGVVGTTRRVKLELGGRSEERVVAITESGLVPDRLELQAVPAVPLVPAPRAGSPPRTASEPAPAVPPEAPKTPKKRDSIDEGTDEFGN